MSRDIGHDLVCAGVRTGSGGVRRGADPFALIGMCHIDGQRRTGRDLLLGTCRGCQHERALMAIANCFMNGRLMDHLSCYVVPVPA